MFGHLACWLYTGSLYGKTCPLEKPEADLTKYVEREIIWRKLWVMVDKFNNERLKATILERYWLCLERRFLGIPPDMVSYVYRNTVASSALRYCVLDRSWRILFRFYQGADEAFGNGRLRLREPELQNP